MDFLSSIAPASVSSLPSASSASGAILVQGGKIWWSNGTAWIDLTATGSGTVTSVGATGSTGLSVGGSPITTSGTLTFTLSANLQGWSGISPSSKADDSAVVHIAGTETVTGAKTFSGGLTSTHSTGTGLIVDRTTFADNSSIQYRTTGGSVWAGVGSAGTSWFVGSSANGTVAGNRWLTVTSSSTTVPGTFAATGTITSGGNTVYTTADASTGNDANTLALRNSSGDIVTRLFRSEYTSTNASIGAIMTQVDVGGTSNNYIRPSTPAQVASALDISGSGVYNTTFTTSLSSYNDVAGTNFQAFSGTSSTTDGPAANYYSGIYIGRNSGAGVQFVTRETAGTSEFWWRGRSTNWGGWQRAASLQIAQSFTGLQTFNDGIRIPTAGSGIAFGSNASTGVDLSSHIALYSTTYGFNIISNNLQVIANGQVGGQFVSNGNFIVPNGGIADSIGNVRTLAAYTNNATNTASATWLDSAIEKTNNTAYTYTIPSGLGARGQAITFVNSGTAGNLTIARGSGVALYRNGVNANVTVGPGSMITIYRSATADRWIC